MALYDHSDQNNRDMVRIVTVWRKRDNAKRHLKLLNNEDKGLS